MNSNSHDILQVVVGCSIILAFLFIVFCLVFVPIPENNREVYIHIAGLVEGVMVALASFYFGSSRGSKDKTDTIANMKKDSFK